MKVGMVVPRYLPFVGGLQSHVEMLATGLIELGWDVTVLTQEVDRNLPRSGYVGDVPVRRFMSAVPGERYPVSPGLARLLRGAGEEFDLVHLHSYHAAASTLGLFVPEPLPVVFTPHYHRGGHTPVGRLMHRFYGPVGRRVVGKADVIIAVSRAEAALLAEDFPDSATRIVVVPNGVRERPIVQRHGEAPILLTIARLERYKRLDLVLEVLRYLPDAWHLQVIGKGPYESAIRQRAASLRLGERLHVSSDLSEEEMAEAISSASAYISLSEKEAFGLTVLEAASTGAPAVVSDIPAHLELAEMAPGSVHVCSGSDPEAIAATIVERAGTKTDCSWVAPLRWSAVCRRTTAIYEAVLQGGIP